MKHDLRTAIGSLPLPGLRCRGAVKEIRENLIVARLPAARLYDFVIGPGSVRSIVIALSESEVRLLPLNPLHNVQLGAPVELAPQRSQPLPVYPPASVLDAFGMDYGSNRTPPASPLLNWQIEERSRPITRIFPTGIRSLDGFCTTGRGQRLCILAEPGVGKTSLLSALAANSGADINVIALIGERGREASEFLEKAEQDGFLERTVLVISTSDESSLRRMAAAYTAIAAARALCSAGKSVLLLFDSLTRFARALRDVGLAAGELPVRRGYPPSVFAALPRLVESCGVRERGSITAFFSVLLSSDSDEDPIVDEIKGLTDGHIVLSARAAERGRYPAVDVLRSLSRAAHKLASPGHAAAAADLRDITARFNRETDFASLSGSRSPWLNAVSPAMDELEAFLRQAPGEKCSFEESEERLKAIAYRARSTRPC